jgi:hypothetical protein
MPNAFPKIFETPSRSKGSTSRSLRFGFTTAVRHKYDFAFEEANAGGSVGLVVDIRDEGSVIRVCSSDCGTDPSGDGFGQDPSEKACAESIDQRNGGGSHGNNEWCVQNYTSIGIFVFRPPYVFTPNGERESSLAEVLSEFPEDRIFSNGDGSFQEYNRVTDQWISVVYCEIVPC